MMRRNATLQAVIRGTYELLWSLQLLSITRGVGRLQLIAAVVVLNLKLLLKLDLPVRMPLRWSGPAGTSLAARLCDITELRVLREIFVGREYDLDSDPAVIVDIGANVGLSVLFFRARYPTARIVAVEASSQNFARLRDNVGGLDNVEILHAAIAYEDGTTTLRVGRRSWAASLASGGDRSKQERVDSIRFGTLLDRYGLAAVDLLKMDIEGAETHVLESSELHRASTIIAELHAELSGRPPLELLDELREYRIGRIRGDTDVMPVVVLHKDSPT